MALQLRSLLQQISADADRRSLSRVIGFGLEGEIQHRIPTGLINRQSAEVGVVSGIDPRFVDVYHCHLVLRALIIDYCHRRASHTFYRRTRFAKSSCIATHV